MMHHGSEIHPEPLAYRLRSSVRCLPQEASFHLVLDYPLKVMVLPSFWEPIFRVLSEGAYVPLEEIVSLAGHVSYAKMEAFLNGLVQKGFLERRGVRILEDYPFVSIVIPVRNRPAQIAACLQSVKHLDYPSDKFEILVIDDASTDSTPDVASRFPVVLVRMKEHRDASFCRNTGGLRAKGHILAFIDSDCIAHPRWLRELVPAFEQSSVGAVGGLVDAPEGNRAMERYEKRKSSLNMGSWFKSSADGNKFFYTPSCNLLVRRDVFLELGGFREELKVGEDVDLCWRIQDSGYVTEYLPLGRIDHEHRTKLIPFCVRRFQYGTSEALLQKMHSSRVKRLVLPMEYSLFWSAVYLSVHFRQLPVLGVGVGAALFHWLRRFHMIRRKGLPVSPFSVCKAVFRGYLAFFHQLCSFGSRYYLVLALLLAAVVPRASAVIFCVHLCAGVVDFFIRKPKLNPLLYLGLFTVDQVSYQAGVWWGCARHRFFRPVNPEVVSRVVQ